MARFRFTKSSLDGVKNPTEEECGSVGYKWYYDNQQVGLWLKVTPRGTKTFYMQYTAPDGKRCQLKLGRLGAITLEQARAAFQHHAAKIAIGDDPLQERRRAREAVRVSEIVEGYREYVKAACKPSTHYSALRACDMISGAVGDLSVETISRADILRAVDKLASTPGTQSIFINYVKAMFGYALDRGLWPESRPLPTTRIKSPKLGKRKRMLTPAEYSKIGGAMRAMETRPGFDLGRLHCIEFLALTGCRPSEAVNLQIEYIDAGRGVIEIPASAHKTGKKTGASKTIVITAQVANLLGRAERHRKERKTKTWVFARAKETAGNWLQYTWESIQAESGVKAHLYSLRSSYVSAASADLQLSDAAAMDLTQHKDRSVWSESYRVTATPKLREDAGKVAELIGSRLAGISNLNPEPESEIEQLRRRIAELEAMASNVVPLRRAG